MDGQTKFKKLSEDCTKQDAEATQTYIGPLAVRLTELQPDTNRWQHA